MVREVGTTSVHVADVDRGEVRLLFLKYVDVPSMSLVIMAAIPSTEAFASSAGCEGEMYQPVEATMWTPVALLAVTSESGCQPDMPPHIDKASPADIPIELKLFDRHAQTRHVEVVIRDERPRDEQVVVLRPHRLLHEGV